MIKEYKENKKAVNDLYGQLTKKQKALEGQQRIIYNKYWELKHKLEEQEREETNILNEAFQKEKAKIKETVAERSKIIDQVKRILLLKEIAKNPRDLSFEVKNYDRDKDNYLELIDTIKTPCLELRVYISENGKPKNKYTLVLVGRSIFADYENKIIEVLHSYGLHINIQGTNISRTLKDSPTVDQLKEWYLKNKELHLHHLLTTHAEVEKEYEIVRRDYNTPEWERLYWENKKDYYENCYSRSTETEEYQAVLRELAKYKTSNPALQGLPRL